MHLSMLGRKGGGGRPSIGEDLTAIVFPQWGLLTILVDFLTEFYWSLVDFLTIHICPMVGYLNRKSQLSSNAPPNCPASPPLRVNIDRCITNSRLQCLGIPLIGFKYLTVNWYLYRKALAYCRGSWDILQSKLVKKSTHPLALFFVCFGACWKTWEV